MTTTTTQAKTRFSLRQVRLNSQGYDSTGTYWGIGAPLYHFEADYPDTYRHVLNMDAERCGEDNPVAHPGTVKCERCGRFIQRVDNSVSDYIRASDRDAAKEIIRKRYPDAVFGGRS